MILCVCNNSSCKDGQLCVCDGGAHCLRVSSESGEVLLSPQVLALVQEVVHTVTEGSVVRESPESASYAQYIYWESPSQSETESIGSQPWRCIAPLKNNVTESLCLGETVPCGKAVYVAAENTRNQFIEIQEKECVNVESTIEGEFMSPRVKLTAAAPVGRVISASPVVTSGHSATTSTTTSATELPDSILPYT